MSLRREMLQVARIAEKALGESSGLVREFAESSIGPHGGGLNRDGHEDLYYTIFVLAVFEALQANPPAGRIEAYLRSFLDGASLDFVHLGALARCWASIREGGGEPSVAGAILANLESHRTADGGYDAERGQPFGNPYGCFLALGAYQDLQSFPPDPLRMVQCLKFCETPDGAWGNARGLNRGATPATAAAVTVLHQLRMPINSHVADWLLAQAHPDGGFLAAPGAPLPDLLSTATALHALACLETDLPQSLRERCLDFLDTLWSAEGGFHGHWADDHLDAEYTFYGLLALGHLTI